MHELAIVSSIVEAVISTAEKRQARSVLAVRVGIGELTQLQPEQLQFCYRALTSGTSIDGSMLEIENVEAVVGCRHCSYHGRPKFWDDALALIAIPTLQCPACGKAVETIQGHECEIKSVRFIAGAAIDEGQNPRRMSI